MPLKFQWHVLEDFIKANNYIRGAELGVRFCQTSQYVLDNCPNVTMIGVDKMVENENPGPDQERYDWDWDYCHTKVAECEAAHPERFIMMRMDMTEAAKEIEDGSLDFIFIDGDHSYEGVTTDIENWTPKVRTGGLISGHDIDLESVQQAVGENFAHWETYYHNWNNCWWTYKY